MMKTNLQFFADPNPEPKPNDSNPNPDGKNPKPAGKTYTQDDIDLNDLSGLDFSQTSHEKKKDDSDE